MRDVERLGQVFHRLVHKIARVALFGRRCSRSSIPGPRHHLEHARHPQVLLQRFGFGVLSSVYLARYAEIILSLIAVSQFASNASRGVVGQWGGAGGAVCEDHFGLAVGLCVLRRVWSLFGAC